jgi:diguanylate cyclase (GGDEF)-like protein/PAS domain S-box-containing protein
MTEDVRLEIWHEVSDEEGRECRMVVVDLSTEVRVEQALRDQAAYQRALLDNFPFIVWLKDSESRFLAVNTPLAQNFGFSSPADLEGKTDFDITSRELAEAYRAADRAVLQSGESSLVEEPIETRGEVKWFETYKSPIVIDGERVGTVGFTRDVTARHAAQAALENSERQYRRFIEGLSLGVTIIVDGQLKYLNAEAYNMVGYAPDECLEQSFLLLVHQGDHAGVQNFCERQMRGETVPQNYDVRLVSKAGRVLDCWIHANVVDWGGRPAVMVIAADVTDYKRMEAELRSLATVDSLTGLANRRHFMSRLQEACARLQRDVDQQTTLLFLDLDHFKEVNDRHGHAVGDAMLRRVATALRSELRAGDVAGRIGGEEFAILLPGTDLAMSAVLAERLRQKIGEASMAIDSDTALSVTVSIGVAAMQTADSHAEQILRRADEALYRAKGGGRNRTEIAVDPNEPNPLAGSRHAPSAQQDGHQKSS